MKRLNQEIIPQSFVRDKKTIVTSPKSSDGKDQILFVDPNCFIVGIDNLPFRMFVTPEFSEEKLSATLQKEVYEVKELIIKPTFMVDNLMQKEYCYIPKWLTQFSKIELLRLQYVDLSNLDLLKDLPIKHLIIEHIKNADSQKLIDAIKQFRYLKEISYDQSLPKELIYSIEKLNLKLTTISD